MASNFISVTPSLQARISVSTNFVVLFDAALDPTTVTSQNIIFEDSLNNPIAFAVTLSSDGLIITINPIADLSNDKVYNITLTTSIKELASPGAAISQTVLTFITETLNQVPVVNLATDGNVNDVFFEAQRVADIFDIRDVVEKGAKYNFAYTPRFFDPIANVYEATRPEQITFDNQTFIKDKFRDQFLQEFKTYLSNIKELNVGTANDFLDIEKVIYPAAEQINNSPGLIANISFVHVKYAEALGHFFNVIVQDPIDEFKYYISTTLPKLEWVNIIKPLVHPVGWSDVFVEVPGPETKIGTFTVDYKTNTFTTTAHGLVLDQPVHLTTTDTLSTPLLLKTTYYIFNPTTNTYQLSLLPGSPAVAIDLTDNGTGTHTLNVLQYFQTEQYAWKDSYLFGDPTGKLTSINEKSFRKGFGVKGNKIAFIIPKVNSLDPPTVDLPTTISADYTTTNVVNYAHTTVLQASGTDGRVVNSGDNAILTDTNLTAFAVNALAGSLIFVLVSEGKLTGQNIGFFTITANTNLATGNTITIAETFPLSERDITYEIHQAGKEIPLSELLAILNKLQFKERFVFSYLAANESGLLSNQSRLTFDEDGNLQLFHVTGSGLPFTFTQGDTTFQYDSDTSPVLFMTSTNFVTTSFTFGNVNLENTVIANASSTTSNIFKIVDIDPPDGGGLQLITFDSSEDISAFQATHQLVISGADSANNGTHLIIDVDYASNIVTIDNSTGVGESSPPSGADAVHSIPTTHNVFTYILPNTFSFDLNLFNGFAIFFDKNKIDTCDITSDCEFDFHYAKYLADIQYPDDATTSGSQFFTGFKAELTDETGQLYQKRTDNGFYKVYLEPSAGFNVTWKAGNFIYEYSLGSSGNPISNTGTLFGVIERAPTAGTGAEIARVTTVGDSSDSLDGTWFSLDSLTTAYYVWFDGLGTSSGAANPAPAGKTEIRVAITTGDLANTIASKIQVAVNENSAFSASVVTNVVTITNVASGQVTNVGDATVSAERTFFTFSTIREGAFNDIIVRFFDSDTDFDSNKYYSNIGRLYNQLVISGTDQVDQGSAFFDLTFPAVTYDRKITLGFNIPDIDTYLWTLNNATDTIATDEQFVLFGKTAVLYDVQLSVQESPWVSPELLNPTIWKNL